MSENGPFQALGEKIDIGTMTVNNRIAMAGMATGFFTKEGFLTERAKNYYEARARGGAGMVIVEATCVDFPRGHSPYRPVIDSDAALSGLSELARSIKSYGAKVAIQLYHAGRIARHQVTGFEPVAPSPIPYPIAGVKQAVLPKELTVEEIAEIVDLFSLAAGRAKRAGFDGIEIHAAHAYLLAQFLSPSSNKRQDSYGGNAENRARILVEVLSAVRKSIGSDYPVWCRITGQEYGIDDALTLDDARVTARMVNDLVDAIHVSGWGYGRSSASLVYLPDIPGALLPLAAEIKKVVTVPVIAVGRIDPTLGAQAIEEGKADIIALGRSLIADPEVPNKILSGNLEDTRPCIACFHCSDITDTSSISIECAVNASAGKEGELQLRPVKEGKKIAVIGGGPAGMEAAYALAHRGHKVVLLEKESRLGGQLALGSVTPRKKAWVGPYLAFLENQVRKSRVDVKLNTEADPALIEALQPDVVVVATGAEPLVPDIPGVDMAHVVTAFDILAGRVEAGKRVVVVGGGSTGCETAEFLHEKGREVIIIEMQPELASDLGPRAKLRLQLIMESLPITYHTAKCTEIKKGGISVMTQDNKEHFVRADTVVLAVGTRQSNVVFQSLRARGFDTLLVGDAWHVGNVSGAVSGGMQIGYTL